MRIYEVVLKFTSHLETEEEAEEFVKDFIERNLPHHSLSQAEEMEVQYVLEIGIK